MKYCIRTQTRHSRKRVRAHALAIILVAGFWLTPVVAQSPILSNDFEREPLGPIGTGGPEFEIDNLVVTAEQADQTPAEVAFSQQPCTAVAGGVVEPAIEVSVLNGAGLPIADPVDVTLSIHSGPLDTGLGGTLSAGTTDGVAVFDDVVFSEWGGYVLRADVLGTQVTGTSDFINVVRDRIFHSRMEYVAPPN